MSQALVQPNSCEDCSSPTTVQIPGPEGDPGADGANGVNGTNAYSLTTAGFTVPAVSSDVTVAVTTSAWMAPTQVVYVGGAGYYQVIAKPTATSVTLRNLGYTGNTAPAGVVAISQYIAPGGIKGTDGVAVGVTLNSISPTTTKGDLILDNGANSPNANNVRLGVGANATVLAADSTQATGVIWKTPKLSATSALDFPSIVNGTTEDLTIALAGAVVGEPVELGVPAALDAGLIPFAFVSATNVVTVRIGNITGAPIDPASGNFTVRINRL